MDLSRMKLFNMSDQKLKWLGERQAVLAQNVANADSPGYNARDIRPINFERTLDQHTRLAVKQTEKNHLVGSGPQSQYRLEDKKASEVYESSPNGNGVILEEQLMAIQDTKLQHDLVTNLYNKQITMFKTALGAGGSR